MPWSNGCNTDVVLGGKNCTWIAYKVEVKLCAVQLSIKSKIFCSHDNLMVMILLV
jgi:hypothetical protein